MPSKKYPLYYSESKGKWMCVFDMHPDHLINLLKKYNMPIKVLEFVEDEYEEVEPWTWRYTV